METKQENSEQNIIGQESNKTKTFAIFSEWQKYLILFLLNTIISVAITVFIMTNYFIKPLAVVDIKNIIDYERKTIVLSKDIPDEKKVEIIAKKIEKIGYLLSQKKEIVLVKEAVINYDILRDYTDEIRAKIKDTQ